MNDVNSVGVSESGVGVEEDWSAWRRRLGRLEEREVYTLWRRRYGIQQSEIRDVCGVAQSDISRWELGKIRLAEGRRELLWRTLRRMMAEQAGSGEGGENRSVA